MRTRSAKNRKPTCSKCGNIKEPNRLKYGYCLACHNQYMNNTRPKHSQLLPEQKLKANCRSYFNQYIRRGKIIKPLLCSIPNCNNTDIQAHHEDYTKPLEVIWLCTKHHIEHHKLISNTNISNITK